MPVFEEKLPVRWKSILFFIFAFTAIYFPYQLGSWELRWEEDKFAAIANEISIFNPNTIAHGEQVPFTFPVFPLLTSFLHKTGISFAFSMRLISVFSLALLLVLVWEAARRAKDTQTAVVAVAVMFSSIIVIEKAMDGFPHFTALLFIFSGWLSWFTF